MYNKVFISYAKEDSKTAEKLFDFLVLYHYDPWLDKRKLNAGEQWDDKIRSALRKSDFIIILFSKTSVSKRGYVQREFKLALDYCEEKLNSDIFIVPCRIDDCEIPEMFSKYQWIDLRNSDSFGRLLGALNLQRKVYMNWENEKTPTNEKSDLGKLALEKLGNAFDGRQNLDRENRMEYCHPSDPNEDRPQYLVVSAHNKHVIELLDVETKKRFPIWQHPKLLPYKDEIIKFGLIPDDWNDGDGVAWINTLVLDVEPYNAVIDVHGAWDNGKRYTGILHLDEDWKCLYDMAAKLGMYN